MAETVEIKTIESLERIRSSVNGTPAYRVKFTDGTSARTKPDSGWAYEAPNSEYHGVPIEVTFSNGGRYVAYARKVES